MGAMLGPLLAAACLSAGGAAGPAAPYGYLWHYAPDGHGGAAKTVFPYEPREGDILFFDDMSKWWEFLYKIGGTAPPFHTGIVFKKHDGSFAVLESGPDDTLHVFLLDIGPRLHTFAGVIQVRRCKVCLTPEKSAQLTAFAYAQEGKRYAVWRLLLQGTPFKSRGPWRSKMFGNTSLDRKRWLCTEIVVSAGTLVGLFDAGRIQASNTYPLDIVDERSYPMLATWHEAAYWCPHP